MAKTKSKKRKAATPRTHRPEELSLEEWQIALRREFGQKQQFKLISLDTDGDFQCANPLTGKTYRIGIRGQALGVNHCTCPDFRINTLGTCKHIEFVLAKLSRKRDWSSRLKTGTTPPYSEVFLRFGSDRQVLVRRGIDCPPANWAAIASVLDRDGVLGRDHLPRMEWLIGQLQRGNHEVRVDAEVLAYVAQLRDAERLRERMDALLPRGIDSPLWNKLLKVDLYPYQRTGAAFLARAGRALLADDMGLGKTAQSLAAVELLDRAVGIERVLIVTLTSIKHQWKTEIERFTKRDANVIQGGQTTRKQNWAQPSFYKIVNYDLLHHDLSAIQRWAPDVIILDEAQRIKNWKTRTAQRVKELSAQHAIVLTGTPLENRLQELHSIVEFVDRYRLGPMFRFLDKHQETDEGGKVVGYKKLSDIARTLEPVLIRRTKNEVLKDLPGRLDKHLFLKMTPQQWDLHEENRELVAKLVAKWRKQRFLSDSDQKRLQAFLQNMRMVCNSTYLLDPGTDYGPKADEVISHLSEILEDPDAKAVIFSQWIGSHELILRRLPKLGVDHAFLHGGVPSQKRAALLDRFRNDAKCRVFLSTDAGGIGLNLQNASAVLIMDQPWNPALLEQRIGRVHRLGQKRPVNVLHFVSEGSIEQGILSLQKFKRGLFAGVLDGGSDTVHLGGTRLQQFMKGIETATEGTPGSPPPENTEPAETFGTPQDEPASPAANATPADTGLSSLADLIGAGKQLFDRLAAGAASGQPAVTLDRDASGRPGIRFNLPDDDALNSAAKLLQGLAAMILQPRDGP